MHDAQERPARLVGHLFIESDGSLSVTPTVACDAADIAKVRATICPSFARWLPVDERLWAAIRSDV